MENFSSSYVLDTKPLTRYPVYRLFYYQQSSERKKRGFIHDIFALMFNFLYYLIVYLQDGYFPEIFSGKSPSKKQ